MRRQGEGLERALDAAGDHAGLAQLWHVRALLWWIKAQSGEAERAWRRAADEALQAGTRGGSRTRSGGRRPPPPSGRRRSDAAIVRCQEIRAILSGDPWAEGLALQPLASLHAMRGEFATAFELLDESIGRRSRGSGRRWTRRFRIRRCSWRCWRATSTEPSGTCKRAGASSSRWASGRCSRRPRATSRRSRSWPDATARRTGSRGAAPPSRPTTTPRRRSIWRQVRARVLAGVVEARRALELAREAVEIAMTTDHLNNQADAMVDLASCEAAGGRDEAATALATAVGSTRPRAMWSARGKPAAPHVL